MLEVTPAKWLTQTVYVYETKMVNEGYHLCEFKKKLFLTLQLSQIHNKIGFNAVT
jgi:hypothetical protein